MINQNRIDFWDKHHVTYFQGGSTPLPIASIPMWQDLIKNKAVLEIGPGDGRQTNQLYTLAKEYSVADISKLVLENFDFDNKYLISDYGINFNKQFDIILLFYVFHHVLPEELEKFIYFLTIHTKITGKLCFNIPTCYDVDADGTTTTKYNVGEFKLLLKNNRLEILEEINESVDNYLFLVKKNG